jgi:uncharacterized membrane protein
LSSNLAFATEDFNSFSLEPTYPDEVGSNSFHVELKPNESTDEYLTIINQSNTQTNTIQLNAVDSDKNSKGEVFFHESNDKNNVLSHWVNFENSEVKLMPGESKTIKFKISAPSDAQEKDYLVGISGTLRTSSTNNSFVKTNYRIIVKALIKITNNPQKTVKVPTASNWKLNYFYFSAGTALIAIIISIFFYFKKRLK